MYDPALQSESTAPKVSVPAPVAIERRSRSPLAQRRESLVAGAPGRLVLVIANGLAVALGGESRRGGLTLRIACETAVGATLIV